jgi:hypothetical protein
LTLLANAEQPLDTFSGRADLIVNKLAAHGETHGFWGGGKNGAGPAMAQFAVGNVDRGRTFARKQLDSGGAMFREFGTMALYMEYHEHYGETLRRAVKQNQLHESVLYKADGRGNLPGASENHKLM